MTRVAALLFLVALAAADSLESAQQAFARGDYAKAETLALDAAKSATSREGAALYLAGLARFRAGRPAEALEALDAAGRAADAPARAQWQYNRGACLYELERFDDAESAYAEAASLDASLAAVSFVNAGYAALDGGAPARASAFAQRARAAATTPAATDLVDDLERQIAAAPGPTPGGDADSSPAEAASEDPAVTEYREGLAAYDLGQYEEAQRRFDRATELNPSYGRGLIMGGAARLKRGERAEARDRFERAMQLRLEPADAAAAQDYLDSMSRGLAYHGEGWSLVARIGSAFDSNVLQSSSFESRERGASSFESQDHVPFADNTTASAALTAGAAASWRARLGEALFAEMAYGFDQVAYGSSTAADYSLQEHLLNGALEYSLSHRLRLGVAASGDLQLTGLSNLRRLQSGAGGGVWAAYDETETTTTRVDVEVMGKRGGSEFAYLSGTRADASLTQTVWFPRFVLDVSYRLRDESIGTLRDSTVQLPVGRERPDLCPGRDAPAGECKQTYLIPFGYLSHTLGAAARAPIGSIFQASASTGVEWRRYLHDSYLVVTPPGATQSTELDRKRREDLRFFASASVSANVWRGLEVAARYDFVANESNERRTPPRGDRDGGDHSLDFNDRRYQKHVFGVETVYRW